MTDVKSKDEQLKLIQKEVIYHQYFHMPSLCSWFHAYNSSNSRSHLSTSISKQLRENFVGDQVLKWVLVEHYIYVVSSD